MEIEMKTRVAKSFDALDKLMNDIRSGKKAKPDWIRLQGKCRLDNLKPKRRHETLERLHASVLRGFKANNVKIGTKQRRQEYWRSVASAGFHDFSEMGWMKCYDSPFVHDYDYIGSYKKGGLDALDPYAVYSSVLGTFDFTVEDFVATELCRDVRTIVEPMAGTAEFSYYGHFRNPDFHYAMIDLDEKAKQRVMKLPWLAETEKHYIVQDILDEDVWRQIKSFTIGDSLSYIGKQSHHLFDAKQLYTLMDVATRHVDYLMLETPQLAPVMDMGGTDDMTRPEMEDAGFEVELVEDEDGDPNPFTNLMHFHLAASDKTGSRKLFSYRDWTVWQQPILVTMARLLDLNALYYHSELNEFVSVEEETEDCDVIDNVTFMLFTRRELETIGEAEERGDS
jgi:hypothetical protein